MKQSELAMQRGTVRGLLLWEYAKLIADASVEKRQGIPAAARAGSTYWGAVTKIFRRLYAGELVPSEIVRENQLLVQGGQVCAYCGATGRLEWEHIIPRSRRGPESIDNLVLSCGPCNRAKADRNPIEWFSDQDLDRKHIPRLVMGKLLKLLLQEHARLGTFEASEFPPGNSLQEKALRSVSTVFDHPELAPTPRTAATDPPG